jgi:ketosteroid isomerase-like protein
METRKAVEAFIGAINSGDVDAISACMAEDHVFIDSLGNRVAGRTAMTQGWRTYLAMFPDYRIYVENIISEGCGALLCGQTHGTFHRHGSTAGGPEVTLHAA